MASSAMEMRSPAVSSMSSSRPGGSSVIWAAWSISSSVVSPIAETTTTTSLPACFSATMRSATRLTWAAEATEEPPYFCTTRATGHERTDAARRIRDPARPRPLARLPGPGCDHRVTDPVEWLLGPEERGNPATDLLAWTEGNLAVPLGHGAAHSAAVGRAAEGRGRGGARRWAA